MKKGWCDAWLLSAAGVLRVATIVAVRRPRAREQGFVCG